MTRKKIKDKIKSNNETIKRLLKENTELRIKELQISDKEQQYYEEEVEVIVQKRPKIIKKQLHGIITWKENFEDEDSKEIITVKRRQVVCVNGIWL